jgi:hypothetical protein
MLQAVEASDGDDSDLLSLAKVGILKFETRNIQQRCETLFNLKQKFYVCFHVGVCRGAGFTVHQGKRKTELNMKNKNDVIKCRRFKLCLP